MEVARGMILSPDETRTVRAARLSQYLAAGGRLAAINSPYVHLHHGEHLYATVPAVRREFFGTEETYESSTLMLGGCLLSLITLGFSAIRNSARKSAAEARAREQWRVTDQGLLHFTSDRLAFQGQRQWFDIWYGQLSASNLFEDSLEFALAGHVPQRFSMDEPGYFFVLFRYLSQASSAPLELPAELEGRARRAGM
jgi:hypothetical protein